MDKKIKAFTAIEVLIIVFVLALVIIISQALAWIELRKVDYNDKYLRDPTYSEMREFLASDKTDLNEYNSNLWSFKYYDCTNFARDLKRNAIKSGIRCAYVHIELEGIWPHDIVAFRTVDKGVMFIEPQNDEEMKVAVGGYYWSNCIKSFKIYWPKGKND